MHNEIKMKKSLFIIIIFILLALNAYAQSPLRHAPYDDAVYLGDVTNFRIDEISGFAFSNIDEQTIWMIDDGENKLFAISRRGEYKGAVKIIKPNGLSVRNFDWEDMSGFVFENRPYLLIADTGGNSNYSRRPESSNCSSRVFSIYVVPEPITSKGQLPKTIQVAWEINFCFQNQGNRCNWWDTESVGVDTSSNRILLLTKPKLTEAEKSPEERCAPRLYSIPLQPDRSEVRATFITDVRTIPIPSEHEMVETDRYVKSSYFPTAMDILGGLEAFVMTYRHAYIFSKRLNEPWKDAFNRDPLIVHLPPLRQGEALCIDKRNKDIYVSSEQKDSPSPIFYLKRKP